MLGECILAFVLILQRESRMKHPALESDSFCERGFVCEVDGFLSIQGACNTERPPPDELRAFTGCSVSPCKEGEKSRLRPQDMIRDSLVS